MTIARAKLVDTSVTRWYHCVTRCVRRALLLADDAGGSDRKQWIEDRLKSLADVFAVAVGGFSVMDNHLHLVLRLDPDAANAWSDEEVARRWGRLFPPRDGLRRPTAVDQAWIDAKTADTGWIAKTRKRLCDLGWFMKCLKEPLARRANREDGVTGAFFEGRFKSVAILDEEALLAVCVYVDLNPTAAGTAPTPETSKHTSIRRRVEHARKKRRIGDLKASRQGSVPGSKRSQGLEDDHWLCPVEDRRRLDSSREGMIEGFPLGCYLLLVDHAGRLLREGKATIPKSAAEILTRLGADADTWCARLTRLASGRLLGRFFAARRSRLRDVAKQLGVHHLANLDACPAR